MLFKIYHKILPPELIETLWNVNVNDVFMINPETRTELIETLWNVNVISFLVIFPGSPRINRNIVECKCRYGRIKKQYYTELIETLWNVNYRRRISAVRR